MKKSGKCMLIIIIVSLWLVNGCGRQIIQNENNDNDDIKIYTVFETQYNGNIKRLEGYENQNYYSMGLWDDNSNCLHDQIVCLNGQEELTMFLSLLNCLGEQYNFTLVIFDNCKQIAFEVDGTSMNQCTVNVKNGKEIYVPIKISSLAKGRHNLVCAIFVDTYDNLTEKEKMYAGSHDDILKSTVIVDNDETVYENKEYLSVDTIKARTDGIVLNKTNGKQYSIEVGNLQEEIKENAIILLDNFEQVSIGDVDSLYECILLGEEEEVIIPLEEYFKKIEYDEKEHVIQAMCIRDVENNGKVFFSNRIWK